jgi:hypothetical protein
MSVVAIRSLPIKVLRCLKPLPVLKAPEYSAISAKILKEIAPKKIKARNSTTRRVMIEHLGNYYCFHSYLGGHILAFSDLTEARERFECVGRVTAGTLNGFQLRFLSPPTHQTQVKGRDWL